MKGAERTAVSGQTVGRVWTVQVPSGQQHACQMGWVALHFHFSQITVVSRRPHGVTPLVRCGLCGCLPANSTRATWNGCHIVDHFPKVTWPAEAAFGHTVGHFRLKPTACCRMDSSLFLANPKAKWRVDSIGPLVVCGRCRCQHVCQMHGFQSFCNLSTRKSASRWLLRARRLVGCGLCRCLLADSTHAE